MEIYIKEAAISQQLLNVKFQMIGDSFRFSANNFEELMSVFYLMSGLAPPALWDLAADKQSMQSEQPLQVSS